MSRIGRAEVERIGHLARLRLAPEEAEALARDLDAVLDHVAELEQIGAAAEAARDAGPATPLRADVPVPSLDPALALANAPDVDGTAFLVPPVLEGEETG